MVDRLVHMGFVERTEDQDGRRDFLCQTTGLEAILVLTGSVASLPPARRTRRFEDVEAFFGQEPEARETAARRGAGKA